jgi:hypothetical protein
MKKPVLALVAAALAVALSGCGGTAVESSDTADSAATSEPTAADEGADESTDEATEEAPADNGILAFGETAKFDDGLQITVTKPKKFTPSEYAAGAEGKGTAVKFQITVKNGTPEKFDPVLVYPTVQSGEAEADAIFDTEQGLEGGPSTAVLPGKTVKWTVGYKVLDTKDITMEISPGAFEYDSVIYTNNP